MLAREVLIWLVVVYISAERVTEAGRIGS